MILKFVACNIMLTYEKMTVEMNPMITPYGIRSAFRTYFPLFIHRPIDPLIKSVRIGADRGENMCDIFAFIECKQGCVFLPSTHAAAAPTLDC